MINNNHDDLGSPTIMITCLEQNESSLVVITES